MKTLFLILSLFISTQLFSQYDVKIIKSEEEIVFDTWLQYKNKPNEYYFFSLIEQEMHDYVNEYISYLGGDFSKPDEVIEEDGLVHRIYTMIYEDRTMSVVNIVYDYENDFILIVAMLEQTL